MLKRKKPRQKTRKSEQKMMLNTRKLKPKMIESRLKRIEIKAETDAEKAKTEEERRIYLASLRWIRDRESKNSWSNDVNTPLEVLSFSDAFLKISFIVGEKEIVFEIQNKTDSGVKINWDDLSFIRSDGNASRVIHSGIRLVNRNDPQAPTLIPPTAKVSDNLIPSENIVSSSSSPGWLYLPLFSNTIEGNKFSLYIPLNNKRDYERILIQV